MIFGNVKDLEDYNFLPEEIKRCFAYAKDHDLIGYEKGSHTIDGDDLFVNIVEYETTARENRFWEAHRNYLDLHLMLRGKEQIDLNFIDNMEQKEFVEKDDFLPLEGPENAHVVLTDKDFLICYPKDGHRTAIAAGDPVVIKKAIFKIKIK
ncbi:YhcH/YjgK/YiaL family protein [Lactonifactor longoviformis]|uniref:YhcH/YjgK/YiaL family protein n=1 Tax=Lactonifactor longoviformis TaxID=341220 RepID=UPI0036F24713